MIFNHHDFQSYWKVAKECISSSMSGIHFGHYKAASKDDCLSEKHAVPKTLQLTWVLSQAVATGINCYAGEEERCDTGQQASSNSTNGSKVISIMQTRQSLVDE
jgi:hypothetical protein